jgi:hypothetical protein
MLPVIRTCGTGDGGAPSGGDNLAGVWAYRFGILDVSAKLGRNCWRNPPAAPDTSGEDFTGLLLAVSNGQHREPPGRCGGGP